MQNNTRALITFLLFMALLAGVVYFGSQFYQERMTSQPDPEITEALPDVTPTPTVFPEDTIREASESSATAKISPQLSDIQGTTKGGYKLETSSNGPNSKQVEYFSTSESTEYVLEAKASSEAEVEITDGGESSAQSSSHAKATASH